MKRNAKLYFTNRKIKETLSLRRLPLVGLVYTYRLKIIKDSIAVIYFYPF